MGNLTKADPVSPAAITAYRFTPFRSKLLELSFPLLFRLFRVSNGLNFSFSSAVSIASIVVPIGQAQVQKALPTKKTITTNATTPMIKV
jgi:hypothetical protein